MPHNPTPQPTRGGAPSLSIRRACLLFIACAFCFCSKRDNDWWVGVWRLDVEHTKSMMKAHNQPRLNQLAIEMGCVLNGNSDYIITTDKIGIMMGGRLVAVPYSMLRRDSNSSVVLLVDETTNTLCLQDGFLISKIPGENSKDAEYYYRRK
jgi:hypothetical protein